MSTATLTDVGDALRGVSSLLYFIMLAQTANVVWRYSKTTYLQRAAGSVGVGLLPRHVVLLGVALVGLATIAVGQGYQAIGAPLAWQTPATTLTMAVTVYGLYLVMSFEYLRFTRAVATTRRDE